ncbi:hypothetical protein [Spirosoma luteum]|uniref:hypothetical protein n=1 Tax=Spirosoma luteum TaxID=431553 RepID=UPI0003808484|nr:hypothetical protein [Spirosoma luteum]
MSTETQETALTSLVTLENIGKWSKKDLSNIARKNVGDVADNGGDTLSLLALAAKLEHFAKEVKEAAKSRGIADLALYGKDGVAKEGVKLLIREVGVTNDYTKDEVWNELLAVADAAQEKLAQHENLLKALPHGGMVIAHPDTGIMYLAFPPVKQGRESIQATIQ